MPERQEPVGATATATSIGEGVLSPREKIEYPCPGCHRPLKVRREFFGSTIACKHCGHQFVPRAASPATDPAPGPATLPPPGADATGDRADQRDDLLRTLGDQVEATQARVDALDSAASGRDEKLMEAIGDLGRLTSDLMAVRLALAALGDDVIAVRGNDSTSGVIESARRVVLDEVASLFQEERERHQERLGPLQAMLDRLHQTHRDFADQHAAALARSESLGERLGVLEASPRVDPEHVARLDRLDSAWEELAAGADALREQSDRLHQQVGAREAPDAEASSPQFDEIRAACEALRAEQEAFRAGLADHEVRRSGLEATVARLEAARAEDRQEGAIRWQDFEASALGRYRDFEAGVADRWRGAEAEESGRRQAFEAEITERRRAFEAEIAGRYQAFEVEVSERQRSFEATAQGRWGEFEARSSERWAAADRLHEQLQQADQAQLARLDQFAAYASRVDTLETDAESFRQVCDAMRDQHAATSRDLAGRLQAFEREVERLREAKPTRTLGPQPVVTAGPVPTGRRAIRPGSAARFDSWPDLDSLIEDLVHERAGATPPAPSVEARADTPVAPEPTPTGRPAPADPAALAEVYTARRNEYYAAMNSTRFADAIPPARFLVDLTRTGTDAPNLDHALWLRNLGIALSMVGEVVEARARLDAALAVCESDAEPAQVPRLMCLFDLVEFCLHRGERWQALDFCERALNLMNGVANIPAVVRQRAEACLNRIQAQGPIAAGVGPLHDPTATIVATA